MMTAIEILPKVKPKHLGEAHGEETTVYRLKLMTPEQIAEHNLEKYVNRDSTAKVGDNDEKRNLE